MIGRLTIAILLGAAALTSPVAAWEPSLDEGDAGEPSVEAPADPSSEPEPEGAGNDAAESAPSSVPAESSAEPPAASPAPEGIYRVTEVYVADVVTVSGPVTTYSTTTIAETPGTYARVIETVDSGTQSRFDGASFNTRLALADGRAVAGTYYENFVLVGGSFIPVSVVFFQDDSESAGTSPPADSPPLVSAPPPLPVPAVPPTPILPAVPAPAPPPGSAVPPPASPAPPEWPAAPPLVAVPIPGGEVPLPSPSRPVVSTSPRGDGHAAIDVLRGRATELWVRVIVDGTVRPAAWWRVTSNEHVPLGPGQGSGAEPLRLRWDRVTPPGRTVELRLEVADVGQPGSVMPAIISISVRSPALFR